MTRIEIEALALWRAAQCARRCQAAGIPEGVAMARHSLRTIAECTQIASVSRCATSTLASVARPVRGGGDGAA